MRKQFFFFTIIFFATLILSAQQKVIPLYNGPLECRLYNVDIVAGSAR